MPWCEVCSKYHAPTAVNEDGTCPVCGNPVGRAETQASGGNSMDGRRRGE